MNEAVHCGEGHDLVGKYPMPFAEGLVRGDEQRSTLVARGDELEDDACFCLVLGDVGDVVEDGRTAT